METILKEAGAEKVSVATGVQPARALLATGSRFDVAIIGIFLDVSAVELALAITESGCPVVLVTAPRERLVLTSPLDRAQQIDKPYSPQEVLAAVAGALQRKTNGGS